jgi:hypothetical protein
VGFVPVLEAGVEIVEIDLAARLDTEPLDVFHGDPVARLPVHD